jgi:hypothetical protein
VRASSISPSLLLISFAPATIPARFYLFNSINTAIMKVDLISVTKAPQQLFSVF